eukprot:TCONS_00049917-protein
MAETATIKNFVDQSKIVHDDKDDKKKIEPGSPVFSRKLDSKRKKSSRKEKNSTKTRKGMKTRLSGVITDTAFYGQDGGDGKLKDLAKNRIQTNKLEGFEENETESVELQKTSNTSACESVHHEKVEYDSNDENSKEKVEAIKQDLLCGLSEVQHVKNGPRGTAEKLPSEPNNDREDTETGGDICENDLVIDFETSQNGVIDLSGETSANEEDDVEVEVKEETSQKVEVIKDVHNFCIECGTKILSQDAKFCHQCGTKIERGTPTLKSSKAVEGTCEVAQPIDLSKAIGESNFVNGEVSFKPTIDKEKKSRKRDNKGKPAGFTAHVIQTLLDIPPDRSNEGFQNNDSNTSSSDIDLTLQTTHKKFKLSDTEHHRLENKFLGNVLGTERPNVTNSRSATPSFSTFTNSMPYSANDQNSEIYVSEHYKSKANSLMESLAAERQKVTNFTNLQNISIPTGDSFMSEVYPPPETNSYSKHVTTVERQPSFESSTRAEPTAKTNFPLDQSILFGAIPSNITNNEFSNSVLGNGTSFMELLGSDSGLDESIMNPTHPHIHPVKPNTFMAEQCTDQDGNTPLHHFVRDKKEGMAIRELERVSQFYSIEEQNKYLNYRNQSGFVVLHTAILDAQNYKIIQCILRHGADVYITDRNGNNIILQIIKNPDFDESHVLALIQIIFKELDELRIQALINDESTSFNADGYSIIHEVVRKNYFEVLKYLRQSAKLNLNAIDRKEKRTGMALACRQRSWRMVNLLLDLKACVNIPTSSEWYPVHASLEDENEKMLDRFMDSGVDIYGYKSIKTSKELKNKCEVYMRRRRRNNPSKDRSTKKRRRCACQSKYSSVRV